MSLYYEAAAVLANSDNAGGSLKSRIYNKEDLKSSPAQLFAVVIEASKWSSVLKEVIERSELLKEERKLTPILALLLTHDLILSKSGVAAPANHALKLAINRHKARLSAEFTKLRIRDGHGTLQAFRDAINDGIAGEVETASHNATLHPRWIRVNTIKTTVAEQLATTFAGYGMTDDLRAVQNASARSKIYYVDTHIPNVLALPPKADLSKCPAYIDGQIIFQDKASCFPAYLLDVQPEDGDVIDGCAAPGNKTTHLAAIILERMSRDVQDGRKQRIMAFEKDKIRAGTLRKMVKLASADQIVSIRGGQDFLVANPDSEEFKNVEALLLDPSCSGSGIVGRDDVLKIYLPDPQLGATNNSNAGRSKKRKRRPQESRTSQPISTLKMELDDTATEETSTDGNLTERLAALSTFQLRILLHAMRFPKARKITYSTCSVYFEENESVVFQALASSVAKERGWRIMKRKEQVDGLRKWNTRGAWENNKVGGALDLTVEEREAILDACIRCKKGTDDGTMGFFVAAFIRDDSTTPDGLETENLTPETEAVEEEEGWNGFSDDEGKSVGRLEAPKSSEDVSDPSKNKKKRKRRKK
ncbi:NOL1/NOP2/Sun domain family [Zopfia rhizophila CBS 207.26]|uniref:NOL1/NOP2/Sun domain family n=1 Tax=Zopfia rhizophila CBS 207.26 TaxID=1314779 RepID=A0A6A6EVU2_9PEZI|nr:NOL1/NOP2/Sun domain family [Zopfia rhizophila CBS 207.26]